MLNTGNKKKITKYRRYSFFNIGTLLFGIVFIYMVICLFMYLTETHITSYEVRRGTITGNYRYSALALRSETVVTADQSGSVRYFVREGGKTSAGSTVCAVNESGGNPQSYGEFTVSEEDASRLRNTVSSFTIDFSADAFQKAYDLKANVETSIAEILQESADIPSYVRNPCTAPESGFVVYHTDGYENLTEAELTEDLFSQNSYQLQDLRGQGSVGAGQPVFKLITKEDWALCFPLDSKLYTELADTASLRFRFLKDNVTFTAPFSIVENNGSYFGKLSLSNSLVRYATDRFLEIELVMNKKEGLKIPTSAVVNREFYEIPGEYAIKNEGTESEITLKVEHFLEDGSERIDYVTANVYQKTEDGYLVDRNLLTEGDYIQMEQSASRRQIQEKDVTVLHGVYNINKGYAVFREITVIDENEEYCIVESNNPYGLAAYDYIVLNAEDVTEDQIVY